VARSDSKRNGNIINILIFWTGLAAPGLSGLILSDVDLSIRRNSFNFDSAEIS